MGAAVAITAITGAIGDVATAPGTADGRPMSPTLLATVAAGLALFAAGPPGGAKSFAPETNPVEVVASKTGFRPRLLNVRKGETLRLALRTADQEHCFALDAFRIEKRLRPGRTILVEITPEKAGSFPFQCCLESGSAAETERGQLVVTD
jgi:heme/copper-type cytochrome/quinol oxidase subunit 2